MWKEAGAGSASASEPIASSARSGRWWLAALLVVACAYLYASLFSLRGVPYFRAGDESYFWTYACRMLSGEVFARDFHQFTPPGTDLVYAAVFRAFGPGVRSADWVILGVGVAVAVVCCLAARAVMRAEWAALAGLVCLVVVYGVRMDATHHWFSALAVLGAVTVLCRGRSWTRIVGAGALLGIAAFFTQTTGVVGLAACCLGLWWERRACGIEGRGLGRRIGAMAATMFATWLTLSWRFIQAAGLGNYWREQVGDLARISGQVPSSFVFPPIRPSRHLDVLLAMADHAVIWVLWVTVCPWVLYLCVRRQPETQRHGRMLVLLSSLGVLEALQFITAVNWNRMAAAAMPATILAVWLISGLGPRRRAAVIACCCGLGALMAARVSLTHGDGAVAVALPTGTALVEANDAAMVAWLAENTRPGECFFDVWTTRFYAPLELRNPTPVDVLGAGPWVPREWVDEAVAGVEQCRARYILWSTHSMMGKVEGGGPRVAGDRLDPLRSYMLEKCERVAEFGNGEQVWERKGSR